MRMSALVLVASLSGCSSGGASPHGPGTGGEDAHLPTPRDSGVTDDLSLPMADLSPQDGGRVDDLAVPRDLSMMPDLAVPADLRVPADLAVAPDMSLPTSQNVDIYVDNFCKMDVIPKKFDVPPGTFLKLTYINHSRDYAVDVWLSYGGGYLDLKTGTSWADRFEFCRYPRPYAAYADISTACSKYRLMINCL
ncbi:MAG: hypothetical protein U0787_23540 [Polyangia bacterium]